MDKCLKCGSKNTTTLVRSYTNEFININIICKECGNITKKEIKGMW
jgi:uncharacterized Zn finger protein